MELLILSHFREASEFQTFTSLVGQELPVFFFFQKKEGIRFFDELVYDDHFEKSDDFFGSGIFITRKEEGFWIIWYENGKKASEGSYRNGKQEGFWKIYSNGIKLIEGSYRNGKQDGFWIFWRLNGEKSSELFYRNGKVEKI